MLADPFAPEMPYVGAGGGGEMDGERCAQGLAGRECDGEAVVGDG